MTFPFHASFAAAGTQSTLSHTVIHQYTGHTSRTEQKITHPLLLWSHGITRFFEFFMIIFQNTSTAGTKCKHIRPLLWQVRRRCHRLMHGLFWLFPWRFKFSLFGNHSVSKEKSDPATWWMNTLCQSPHQRSCRFIQHYEYYGIQHTKYYIINNTNWNSIRYSCAYLPIVVLWYLAQYSCKCMKQRNWIDPTRLVIPRIS